MMGRLGLLGQRVLARHAAPPRAGGLRLAQKVTAARVPEKIVETSTRLAQGRSIGRQAASAPAAAPEAALPRPPGMSEFAARWIFGDGPAEGIPIAGEAAMPELAGESEKPSFLLDRDKRDEAAAAAEVARRAQPVQRGQVQEVPAGFRLSRRPVDRPEAPPPLPYDTPNERVVDETPAPEPVAAELPPVLPEPPSRPIETIRRVEPPASTPAPASISRVESPPPPVPAEPQETEPPAVSPETPSEPAVAASDTHAPQPAPPPRVPLTLARKPAERPVRPALQLQRRPVEPLDGPEITDAPAAEAPAVAARPGILRRVVDTVLRRESAPAPVSPPVAQAEPAASQQPTSPAAPLSAVSPPAPTPPRQGRRSLARAAEGTPAPEPGHDSPPEEAPAPEAAPETTPALEGTNAAVERAATAVESPPTAELASAVEEADPEQEKAQDPVPFELKETEPSAAAAVGAASAAAGGPPASAPPGQESQAGASPGGEAASAPSAGADAGQTPGTSAATAAAAAAGAPVVSQPAGSELPVLATKRKPIRSLARAIARRPEPEVPQVASAPAAASTPAPGVTPAAPGQPAAPVRATLVQRAPAPTASGDWAPEPAWGDEQPPAAADTSTAATTAVYGAVASTSATASHGAASGRMQRSAVATVPARPLLRLASPSAVASRPATVARAEAPAAPARGFGGTSGARLAAATGGILRQEDGETETLVFPRPQGRAFAPAFALMREPDPAPADGGQPQAADASPSPAQAPPPAPPAQGGGGGGGDIEEIYDQVIERLRRELLADRERMGDVLGDLP